MKLYKELRGRKDVSTFRIIIFGFQLAFALFGIMLSLGALLSGGFLNFIAALFLVISALIIAPIIDFIPIIKKYSLISLIPRAAISFSLVMIAVLISPSKKDVEKPTREAIITTSVNEYLEETTTSAIITTTTTSTTAKTTTKPTTTISTSTTKTTATTTTTTAVTEPPTPAPTEPPIEPPTPVEPVIVESDYVLNTSTMKAHKPRCRDVDKIDYENRYDYYGTVEEIQAWGYGPCGHCHPW